MKNEEFSDEKLNELLKNSTSSQSFNVPEGYFEELPEKVMNSINVLPDFDKQSAVQPFEVPSNYFEELPFVINDRILAGRKESVSIWKWIFNPTKQIIAALSITIIAGSYFYFSRTKTIEINNSTCTVEEISESPYFESLSDDDLIDFLASQQDENTIDEYDQYLLDNDIDISQLEKSL